MNTIGYFEIQSSETAREIEFYKTVFGWTFIKDPHIPIEYYRLETNGMNGGLMKRPVKTPPSEFGTNAFTCSIQVENFDETAKTIMTNGGKIA